MAQRVRNKRSARVRPTSRVLTRGLILLFALGLTTGLGTGAATADPGSAGNDANGANRADADSLANLRTRTADVASQVASLDVSIAQLDDRVDRAWDAVARAGEDYTEATVALTSAQGKVHDAQLRRDQALKRQEASRRILVGIAREAARGSAGTDQLQAILQADGLDSAVANAHAIALVTSKSDRAVQQYQADSVVAATLERVAQDAVAEFEVLQQGAAAKLKRAEQRQTDAEELQEDAGKQRADLVDELAGLRETTAAAERRRQQRLADERRAQREEQARKTVEETTPQTPPATDPTPDPDNQPGSGNDGKSGKKKNKKKNKQPGGTDDAGGTDGTDTDGGESEPATPPGNSDGASQPPGATDPGTSPPPVVVDPPPATPNPPKLPPPPVSKDALGTGISIGTAKQGKAAVAEAKKQLGKDYVWAASGPTTYDCSGLTMHSWREAGVALQRTSRSQYVQVLKIKLSDMRPGDLLFWGDDPGVASSIYHVAMYIGDGQMIEAPRPGLTVRTTPVRYTSLMPYAGRP